MTRALPLLLIFALSTCVDEDDRERVPLVVVAPLASADEPAREDALAVLVDTLTAMGHAPRVERLASAEWAPLFDRIMPALVIALDADALALDVPGLAPDPERRFDDRFALDLFREGRAANPIDGAPGTLVVALTSRTTLGRFYAVYELLRRLGARYYHPEDEWIPPVPLAQLTSRATRPTALGPGPVYTPDFTHRSFSFHGAHPLELGKEAARPEHRVAAPPLEEGGTDRGVAVGVEGLDEGHDGLGAHPRHVAERHDHPVGAVGERA